MRPRPRKRQTQITLRDFTALEQLFMAKPDAVLAHFATCQIYCLSELPMWKRLKAEQPLAAARIVFVAATMGITES